MNVLVVLGKYFPNTDANVVCTEKLIEALKEQGHMVDIVIPKKKFTEPECESVNGNTIHRFCSDVSRFYLNQEECFYLSLPLKMRSIHRIAFKIFSVLNKFWYKVRDIDFLQLVTNLEIEAMAYGIKNICRKKKIAMVLSVSVPFTSHLSVMRAYESMENHPKWMIYMLDPYAGSEWINAQDKRSILKRKTEERSVFKICDKIIMMNVLKTDYDIEEYAEFHHKIRYLKPPLFAIHEDKVFSDDGIIKTEDSLACVYAGTLYDSCRNNESVFRTLEWMANQENCSIHIMGKTYPKCGAEAYSLSRKYPERFRVYGQMPYVFAKESMQRADVLINIGNDYEDIIPSKIFEYMAARKPIMHFYRIDNDTALPYLLKYPFALCVDERKQVSENEKQIHQFLLRVKNGVTISIDEMICLFHDDTTENVQQDFIEIVEESIDR